MLYHNQRAAAICPASLGVSIATRDFACSLYSLHIFPNLATQVDLRAAIKPPTPSETSCFNLMMQNAIAFLMNVLIIISINFLFFLLAVLTSNVAFFSGVFKVSTDEAIEAFRKWCLLVLGGSRGSRPLWGDGEGA